MVTSLCHAMITKNNENCVFIQLFGHISEMQWDVNDACSGQINQAMLMPVARPEASEFEFTCPQAVMGAWPMNHYDLSLSKH